VAHEHDLAAGWVQRVDHLNDRGEVVAQGDLGAVGVVGLHAGQRERVGAVPGLLQGGNDLVPRRAVEPETGDQDDVHGPRLDQATDIRRGSRHDRPFLLQRRLRGVRNLLVGPAGCTLGGWGSRPGRDTVTPGRRIFLPGGESQ
jgi:hypothetical protein